MTTVALVVVVFAVGLVAGMLLRPWLDAHSDDDDGPPEAPPAGPPPVTR